MPNRPPAKCPFCSAPVEGGELACRQCGFDLDRHWSASEGAGEGESEEPFNLTARTCHACGFTYPIGPDGRSLPGIPYGSITSKPDARGDCCPNCGASVWAIVPGRTAASDRGSRDPEAQETSGPPSLPVRIARMVAGGALLFGGAYLLVERLADLGRLSPNDTLMALGFPLAMMAGGYYLAFVLRSGAGERDKPFLHSREDRDDRPGRGI